MLLVHLEDPGAVRFVAPLLERLSIDRFPHILVTSGAANEMLVNFMPRSVSVFDDVVFDLSQATLVLVGTSENTSTIAFDIIQAAQKACVPVIGAVDSFVNASHRFAGITDNPLAHAPDWLLVPNERTAAAFSQFGFMRERIFVVGHPARESVHSISLPKRTDVHKRLVFISEVSTGLNSVQYRKSDAYTLLGRGCSLLRTPIVVEELLDSITILRRSGWEIELVLRLHPKESLVDLGPLVFEFDMVSSGGDPMELLCSSDLVIGMSSMLLSEAHVNGLPCLAILPREEERQWLDETANGSIPTVTLREQIISTISRLLLNPSVPRCFAASQASSAVDNMLNSLLVANNQIPLDML